MSKRDTDLVDWLKSFPVDEEGTPSGKITPGIYVFVAMIIICVGSFIAILALLDKIF